MYNLDITLSDIDRGVYEELSLRVARHPSETLEYMLMRVLAYCLEFQDGISFTDGVAAADQPAVIVRNVTGQITAWIEVGFPAADRLHRGSKQADRTAVYTHRNARKLVADLSAAGIHRAEEIPIYAFDPDFVGELASLLERRSAMALTLTERILYVGIAGRNFTEAIEEHRLTPA